MLRAGIIGFGVAGRYFHAPLLRAAGFEVPAVVSSRAQDIHAQLPEARVLESAAHLVELEDIDLVVIATPTHLHAEQVHQALAAGKHVVTDKPMCVTAQQARELHQLAQERGRMLAVFQNRRWDSDFLTLRRLLAGDELGTVYGFHARWDRYRPALTGRWRERPTPGAGVLYDLGSHFVDQVLVLFGKPEWVQADVFMQREGALVDDGFELIMGRGQLRITLGVTFMASEPGDRYRVHGLRASFVKRTLDPQEDQLRAGMQPLDPQFGVERPEQWGCLVVGATGERHVVESERGRWLEFYRQVASALQRGETTPPISALEAAETLEVIEAAAQSGAEGRRIEL